MLRSTLTLLTIVLFAINTHVATAEQSGVIDRLSLDLDLETYFDNRENANSEELRSRSGSDFALKLAPTIKYNFYGAHSIVGGVSWVIPFGDIGSGGGLLDDPYYNNLMPIVYYSIKDDRWSIAAGLFPHSETMIGSYSTAFFADDYLFYDNVISGVMGRYSWQERSYVEMICWWQSQPSNETREIFSLLSSANVAIGGSLYAGYSFSLTHFAGSKAEGENNVVDNALANPFIGFSHKGRWLFDMRAGVLVSMQRDRSYGNEWQMPVKGEVGFSLSRWGFTLDERFYYGDDLMPLYDGHPDLYYANTLYMGDPFFRADGVYNRAEINYQYKFANDIVGIDVGFVTHFYEGSLNTEQRLRLTIMLNMKRKYE
ncbi:MAG: hypothetical protein SNG35_00800 [Rikenellaceae bacterium]